MPYIIDGHNLIPKVPGLRLEAMDDEMQLVEMLQEFCRLRGKQADVFFDNAPPGGSRARNFGRVIARFARQGTTADDAIRARLARLGKAARNWTVVSSDQAVQASARAAQAHYISSEAFAELLVGTLDETQADLGEDEDTRLDPDELDDWLHLFGADQGEG
jgi:predicted RNA-binding protein with PIN domain